MSDSKLKALREDIDKLDSQLLELFQKRAEKAAEIYKAKGEGSPWRPAREAAHLRELCEQVREAGGALTEQRVRRIWRAIYADSVASQSRLTIYATRELEIAVREHFGNDIDFAQKQNTEEVLNAVNSADSSAVAAIALKDGKLLLGFDSLFVHEGLRESDYIHVLLIAKRPPEFSEQGTIVLAACSDRAKMTLNQAVADADKPVYKWENNIPDGIYHGVLGEEDISSWFDWHFNIQCELKDLEFETGIRYLGVIPRQGKES